MSSSPDKSHFEMKPSIRIRDLFNFLWDIDQMKPLGATVVLSLSFQWIKKEPQ